MCVSDDNQPECLSCSYMLRSHFAVAALGMSADNILRYLREVDESTTRALPPIPRQPLIRQHR
jgi:hypothetical protein